MSPAAPASCTPVTFRGHVSNGESYAHELTPALEFKLEAVPAGWMVRILPRGTGRPPHDYAELANPPYLSPTPLLISTDFAFRAQDAIAWNPRAFRYFTDRKDLEIAEAAYQTLQKRASDTAAVARLLAILSGASEATLTILDAELTGGTADQSATAAGVASHLAQTAHRIRPTARPTPLGKLLGLSFQVDFPVACSRPLSRH